MPRKPQDLTGQRFGKLVAVRLTNEKRNSHTVWECKCDCGKTCYVDTNNLKSGKTKSCGCGRANDISGRRFGKLVVVGPTKRRTNNGQVVWECRCDCGAVCFADADWLKRRGRYENCRHGPDPARSRLPKRSYRVECERLHKIWIGMHNRCGNPRATNYRYYGARGIRVCDEWRSYPKFEKWAFENGYDPDANFGQCTIDRIDVNGGYSPDNCRFVDMKTQNRNRTNNKHVVGSNGNEYRTIVELAETVGGEQFCDTISHQAWHPHRRRRLQVRRPGLA